MDPKKETMNEEELKAHTAHTGQQDQGETEKTAAETQEQAGTEKTEQVDELTKTQEELANMKDKYLRLSAEFDNYRKRTMKEKAELILNGGEKSISSILPIVDDFERALKNMETAEDVAAVREGVELIYNKFMTVLGQNGVKVIETKEQPLNTDFHEAIAVIPAPAEELKGKILDCVQTGYTLNDKVIRHAKVVVGE
ncbi:nucleotide exchange factor GrpE [Caecibacteroides pullorum]|uniref:Protein GrpE n=1 Tax=Caecibacteroides pullorum TaxID=2725562 RepID=A0AA41D6V7_9BACT|nr:nucleotide exchange factor GrpE [Caecibacteroides pullorum]MBM6856369.1 nucleotide exchange factor GrpE [Caecibacteroides pullorum]MBV8057376.1 nucleotide exchange factor GrpE [Caecibacteroides pullorum]